MEIVHARFGGEGLVLLDNQDLTSYPTRERKMDHEGHPYKQQHLAQMLGGITEQAVRDLENKDAGMDFDRRQFLSKWLDIPPILLGVITLDQIRRMGEERGIALTVETSEPVFVSGPAFTGYQHLVDPKEYREKLVSYWKTDNSHTAYGTLADTLLRTSTLYQELPHVKPKERYQLYELLCSYHQFTANLLRDKQKYDDAIIHLNKAYCLAKLLRKDELKALVLYSRGYILCSANRMKEALQDFNKAMRYENKLPDYLNGPIHMYTGVVRAKTAKTKRKKKEAIVLLDSGGKIVRANPRQESPYFIDFSLDRYHLDKSTALIAVGQNDDAIEELKLVKGGFQNVRKQAYNDILQAQAHVNVGNYSEAASLAEIALLSVQDIHSISYVARVEKIYKQLQEGPYKNSPDVAHLDYLLHYKR